MMMMKFGLFQHLFLWDIALEVYNLWSDIALEVYNLWSDIALEVYNLWSATDNLMIYLLCFIGILSLILSPVIVTWAGSLPG